MKYHELATRSFKPTRRLGRGISAGQGKTAGRGTKGQNSRAGSSRKPGFEGGQNPLMQRLPKLRGFTSHRPKSYNVYTGQLADLGTTVDNFSLAEAGLVPGPYVFVKLIVKGDLTNKVNVKLQGASKSAITIIKQKGGNFTKTPQVKRQPKDKPDEVKR